MHRVIAVCAWFAFFAALSAAQGESFERGTAPAPLASGDPRFQITSLPPVATPASHAGVKGDKEESLEERLEKLEKALAKQEEKEQEKKEKALKKPSMSINGRMQLDYWTYPYATRGIDYFENPATGVDPEDRFLVRRLRLEFKGDITSTMLYDYDIEFSNPNNPEFRDAYIGFKELPHNQQVLIGNQKRPYGLDVLNSTRINIFMERPTSQDAFNEDYRRLGVCAYGYSDSQVYNWRYGVFNLENVANDGRYLGDSLQLSGSARLASSPWYDETSEGRGYFHWGIGGLVAHPDGNFDPRDSNENEARFRTRSEDRATLRWLDTERIPQASWFEVVALESALNIGPWQFVGEYISTFVQRDAGPDVHLHGAYCYAAYFLTGEYMPYDRKMGVIDRPHIHENFFLVERCRGGIGGGWGAWQVALRLSYIDLSDEDIQGGEGHNVALGLNWYWTDYSKLQFNAIYGTIDDRHPANGYTSGEFVTLGTRFACDF